ncbi:uncharacterized protein B0H18DRAFT_1020355 [Fomitopsis serialis]|uniref:uncharacterized protein n=1 Tax=Fomitopsis serialis TaxID=139415 RepID=UPI00200861E1|nr:uncharacterized protein B0H18DRAFT_1020355 [Neoantrodia serialis]KAH9921821.1 hypothetical protein B0H18DRAFT_1020355 [Neoantrodia serialis]
MPLLSERWKSRRAPPDLFIPSISDFNTLQNVNGHDRRTLQVSALLESTNASVPNSGVQLVDWATGERTRTVCRVLMQVTADNGEGVNCRTVICKVIYGGKRPRAALHHEKEVYDVLEELQGDIIPRCYGLFEGELGGELATCLVLEEFGEPLTRDKSAHEDETFRIYLMSAILELHRRGIQHNDLVPGNIRKKSDGSAGIIDFEAAVMIHHCPVADAHAVDSAATFEFGKLALREVELPCKELWETASHIAAIWKPSTTGFGSQLISVHQLSRITNPNDRQIAEICYAYEVEAWEQKVDFTRQELLRRWDAAGLERPLNV